MAEYETCRTGRELFTGTAHRAPDPARMPSTARSPLPHSTPPLFPTTPPKELL